MANIDDREGGGELATPRTTTLRLPTFVLGLAALFATSDPASARQTGIYEKVSCAV